MSDVDDDSDSEEPARPDDPVMATFRDLLDHAVACTQACRVEGVACLHATRLGRRHREAKRAARTARRSGAP